MNFVRGTATFGMSSYAALSASIICVFAACKFLMFLNVYWWRPRQIKSLMQKQGVTGPPPRFMLGNLLERAKMREREVEHDMHRLTHDIVTRLMPDYVHWSKIYGKQFLFWWRCEPRLTVYDPELIREILSSKHVHSLGRSKLQRQGVNDFIGKGLLMANGQAWAHQRRVVAPAFHLDKLKGQVGYMVECATQLLVKWDEILNNGLGSAEIEVGKHMSRLAGNVIAQTEFGSSFEKGKRIFAELGELQKMSTESGRQTRAHVARIRQLKKNVERSLLEIIQARRDSFKLGGNSYGNDLLGLMLSETDADSKGRYSSQQLIDECKTFFFTGHETTTLLLTWTMMLLASNPIWQERAREEVWNVLRGGQPNAECLGKLKVLGMILFESLRLYTPATLLAKQAFSDIKLSNLLIPKGLSIWIPVLAIHHDKNIWGADANEFNPQRFEEGIVNATKHPMGYLPFSLGPRNCVGQNFAIIEAKVVLAMILSRFRFHLSKNYRHAPVFILTLKPKHGVPIIIESLK